MGIPITFLTEGQHLDLFANDTLKTKTLFHGHLPALHVRKQPGLHIKKTIKITDTPCPVRVVIRFIAVADQKSAVQVTLYVMPSDRFASLG